LLKELSVPTDVRTAALSGGQRQRLAIARTLAYDPDVILYDEPTSGLDPATAHRVANLIESTHRAHRKTSIIVTHDYGTLEGIADQIYLLDSETHSLVRITPEDVKHLADRLTPTAKETVPAPSPKDRWQARLRSTRRGALDLFAMTSRVGEEALLVPLRFLPRWKSPYWGGRYLVHYLGLIAGPSAWVYLAIAGAIIGFVATYFTFKYLPYAGYTEPLLIENLLASLGFALYRILVPVLGTVLIAARCGAAVASDVGGKVHGQQMDAMRSFGARPSCYLLTGIVIAFAVGTPILNGIGFLFAKWTSLVVFTAIRPQFGPDFWELHFHSSLFVPDSWRYYGMGWLYAKVLLCGIGIAEVAYHIGSAPKTSSRAVSAGITSTILWSTLYVLVVHFGFAFFEFE
jgi:energy-coupling factor transporter ATP-binding protein EcfA2